MIEALILYTTINNANLQDIKYNNPVETFYTLNIDNHFNTYLSEEEIMINNLINDIKKISSYEIENYDFENIDDDMIALGIKLKNFPADKNKVAYSIELMNKLDEKLPDNIDIFVV
jgi:hypothetical protein